jgi:hypothetical protein
VFYVVLLECVRLPEHLVSGDELPV